ncbi:MAG TPA: hypothetical protein VHZ78_02590 [Rhizomicrobium sp.]|jgi:hypothetical protein|nr:hypothetical protein [Rhizomicrobium sp.]
MRGFSLTAVLAGLGLLLAGCASGPAQVHADLIVLGRVTAVSHIALMPKDDPDQFFSGHVITFQTFPEDGKPGATIQFIGLTGCPADVAGDQAYLLFLDRGGPWLIADENNPPLAVDWSNVLTLSACTPIDAGNSRGLLNYNGPPPLL